MNQMIQPMLGPLTRWAKKSQHQARRNAMVASTNLAAGRRERDETQEFIATLIARRARRAGAAPPVLPAARLG